jgi:hypothetical protein
VLADLELSFEEFSSELDALAEMAAGAPGTQLTSRARIAAANGATLLLAATFEEFVRQQVKTAYQEKARRATTIADFPDRIASRVWRRSLEKLARTNFAEIEANTIEIDKQVASILSFCLRKELNADVGETLAHNESNMQPRQLNELFNNIGIKDICAKSCEFQDIIDHLGCDSAGKANALLVAKVEDFFKRRNLIAHAIKFGSSSGPSELFQDIETLRIFGLNLSKAIDNAL